MRFLRRKSKDKAENNKDKIRIFEMRVDLNGVASAIFLRKILDSCATILSISELYHNGIEIKFSCTRDESKSILSCISSNTNISISRFSEKKY